MSCLEFRPFGQPIWKQQIVKILLFLFLSHMHFCMLKILAQKCSELTLKKQKVNGICERMSSIWFFPLHKLSLPLHTHDCGTFSPSVAITRKKGVHFYSYPFFSIYIFSQNNTIVDLCCALTAGIALKTFTKIIIALVLNCLQ